MAGFPGYTLRAAEYPAISGRVYEELFHQEHGLRFKVKIP